MGSIKTINNLKSVQVMCCFQISFVSALERKKTHFQCSLDIRNTDKGLRIVAQKECNGKISQNMRGVTGGRSNQLKLEQKEASTKRVLKKTVNSC